MMTDRTAELQALLDQGGDVYVPGGEYWISKTLKIRDNTTLRLAPDAVIHLMDGARCALLENEGLHERRRNRRITVAGGIWDGNNAHQSRDDMAVYNDEQYWGIALRFVGVEDLMLTGITVKDPESYGFQITDVSHFTVEHITFDYNLLRPNMDGVHIQGPARFGVIRDVKGATNDDMVALNCVDGEGCDITQGDIEDILIDGLFCECGYTAVRLLSNGGKVLRNVHVTNIFGTYRFYAVSFTQEGSYHDAVLLESITVDHVFASKPTRLPPEEHTHYYPPNHAYWADREPIFWFQPGIHARDILISDVSRTEQSVTHAPLIKIDENTVVENLTLRNIRQRFTACDPVPTVKILGTVRNLRKECVQDI